MKKTLHIDDNLLKEARLASKAATDTETVRLGLEALVRHAAYERLRALQRVRACRKSSPPPSRGALRQTSSCLMVHLVAAAIVGRCELRTAYSRLGTLADELDVAFHPPDIR
jgi:hypothetical protein